MGEIKRTGIILASGEGSRLRDVSAQLGLPKHLFPLGAKSLFERSASELSKYCEQIIVITRTEDKIKFEHEASKFSFPVQVFEKSQDGFQGDFAAAYEFTRNDYIVLTVGDLVFPEGEMEGFIKRSLAGLHKLWVAFDRSVLFQRPFCPDFRMLMGAMPKEMLCEIIELNPESFVQVLVRFFKLLFRGRLKVVFQRSLFNINTPESYRVAKEFYEDLDK